MNMAQIKITLLYFFSIIEFLWQYTELNRPGGPFAGRWAAIKEVNG